MWYIYKLFTHTHTTHRQKHTCPPSISCAHRIAMVELHLKCKKNTWYLICMHRIFLVSYAPITSGHFGVKWTNKYIKCNAFLDKRRCDFMRFTFQRAAFHSLVVLWCLLLLFTVFFFSIFTPMEFHLYTSYLIIFSSTACMPCYLHLQHRTAFFWEWFRDFWMFDIKFTDFFCVNQQINNAFFVMIAIIHC